MIPRNSLRPFSSLVRIRRKHKVAVVIGFYGGKFAGMQCNVQKTSIEDQLIQALYSLGKIEFANVYKPSKFDWERCSRTDKGVSAMKIVVTGKMLDYEDEFGEDLHSPLSVNRLNEILPADIRVFSYVRISNHFNPHLNTFARQYSYLLPVTDLKRLGVDLDRTLFEKSLQVFQGTHYMKNYSGSIRHWNKSLRQFYVRTINSINVESVHLDEKEFWNVTLNGNSFLYHQIRKMIGAAVATSCGSWSFEYLQKSFELSGIQVPLAPSTPLALRTVSFRSDKHVYLDQSELEQALRNGKHRKNDNPNKFYDNLLLLNEEENRQSELFFHSYIFPRMVHDISLDQKEFDHFVSSLHLGLQYV